MEGPCSFKRILSVTIYDDIFTSSYVNTDGGAVYMDCSSLASNIDQVINTCTFINCKGDSSARGGVCAPMNNQYNNFIANSLFSECCNAYTGVLWLNYLSITYPSSSSGNYPVQFCFFNKNYLTSSNNDGRDIYLSGCSESNSKPILCSFTTSTAHNSVYPEHSDETMQHDK